MSQTDRNVSPRVLHIRRSDEAESYVLLRVSRSDSTALELNITATEGESPYTTTLRQSHLKNSCSKNFQGSAEEWKDIVLYVFGLLKEPARKSDLLAGIEISASINGSGDEDKEMVITVRKRIQAITQRLGSITLSQDDEQAIELFEWSNIAISRADALEKSLDSLLDRYRAAEETINLLNRQLEEFITSKNQHEDQLMADFVRLLNEKKLKIRNQQRLLASTNVDPEKLSEMEETTTTSRLKPNAKKGSKRSAAAINDSDSESEGGFEKMEVDNAAQKAADGDEDETDDDDDGRLTPQPLEDDDNTTSDEEGFGSPVEAPKGDKPGRQEVSSRVEAKSPPPRRELPFINRKAQKVHKDASLQPPRIERDADETGGETDDDEL
ncbi:hypothetical protein P175DRAFT_0458910 [Aspergillus ochraceoroseus IBT 24754]|uniref:DNA double-strand break repair and VJ recombination XRCC4 n=3 Tax=Aspergillus subgen. Nidulantes TaxID=2720870 RepID=A0A0F8WXG6_9EURO|nr:uncharacterized protein P175DRAFT_0458910 [Aspergillus ochraceoroseus IBT 24754]KKK16062.1 hypothetical protein ARAM_000730 [Aspergillus rambellii]KKK16547.1 hypothetical protein AOCH_002590 [Aspergillus ochraceoroseus]PTU20957.1 hypothetical protein P175DRAFT_0458910 [Aspergillus ochraceoroseus IBT 24754]